LVSLLNVDEGSIGYSKIGRQDRQVFEGLRRACEGVTKTGREMGKWIPISASIILERWLLVIQ